MKALRRARKTLKTYGEYSPSFDIVPEEPCERNAHAWDIIIKAEKVLVDVVCGKKRGCSVLADHCSVCCLQEDHCSCMFTPQCGLELCARFAFWHSHEDVVSDLIDDNRDSFYVSSSGSDATVQQERDLDFIAQSGSDVPDITISSMGLETTQQNVTFQDQVQQFHVEVDGDVDKTRMISDDDSMPLQDFMKRPIRIFTSEWSSNILNNYSFNPWELFFKDPTISNRISNYKLLRTKLRIRVVINGNGFYYGRIAMFYKPLDGFDGFGSTRELTVQDFVQNSQCPCMYIDPTLSQGGEMTLPFFWHENYFDITTGDVFQAGQMYLQVLNPLKHANDVTAPPLTLTVFAWAEDFDMSLATTLDAASIAPQSGEEIDEANKDGVVSGPATKISRIAGMMGKIPMIGPFASATAIGADAVAGMARVFGYCRPPVTVNPEPFRPHLMSSLALTNVPDTPYKLTVDDKQELSIDPRISGIGGEDQFNILRIAQKESYLTTFTWSTSENTDKLLWNSVVAPGLWNESNLYGGTAIHLPACAVAAMPFTYWTGSIRFRFQIVASAYHKGRLKVAYDPAFFDDLNAYNQNHMRVIDIADEQDFVIELGMSQQRNFVKSLQPGKDGLSNVYGVNPLTPSGFNSNGVIAVQVLNALTAPNYEIDNDIAINVYLSVGDDFEVASPSEEYSFYETRRFEPQSGDEHTPDSMSGKLNTPEQPVVYRLGPKMVAKENLFDVYFGERILSFRSMLKRYNLHAGYVTAALPEIRAFIRTAYPYHKGYMNSSFAFQYTQDAAGNNYNYANMTMVHWMTLPFSGWRGSIRYKAIPTERTTRNDVISVERLSAEISYPSHVDVTTVGRTKPTNPDEVGRDIVSERLVSPAVTAHPLHGGTGAALTNSTVNPCLEFEIPFYSSRRFLPGRSFTQTNTQNSGYEPLYNMRTVTAQSSVIQMYVAAGEDFQSYFWIGMPPLFYREFSFGKRSAAMQ